MNDSKLIKTVEHWEGIVKETNADIFSISKNSFLKICGLIKRQKAEIERLKEEIHKGYIAFQKRGDFYRKEIKSAKSKAIKEFADKIDYLVAINNGVPNRAYRKISKDIKNLVKEMVGDDNA